MNEVINWIALNNTLMIRVGFSAVLLLIIVYVFRYFFIPQISVVTQAEEAALAEETSKSRVADEKLSSELTAADDQAKNEEIEMLKAEVDELKVKLAETPKAVGPVAVTNTKETELVSKIISLEARLFEYEIIAEDIAEISKLRSENEQLKQQFSAGGGTFEPMLEAEVEAEAQPVAESIPAGEFDYSTPNFAEPTESQLVISSEVEVSEDEQALINDFEDMIRKKG